MAGDSCGKFSIAVIVVSNIDLYLQSVSIYHFSFL